MFQQIPLTDTPRALREYGLTVSYQILWRAAMEGRIPAVRQSRRWFIRVTDLDTIAATFAPVEQ